MMPLHSNRKINKTQLVAPDLLMLQYIVLDKYAGSHSLLFWYSHSPRVVGWISTTVSAKMPFILLAHM